MTTKIRLCTPVIKMDKTDIKYEIGSLALSYPISIIKISGYGYHEPHVSPIKFTLASQDTKNNIGGAWIAEPSRELPHMAIVEESVDIPFYDAPFSIVRVFAEKLVEHYTPVEVFACIEFLKK